MSRTIALALGLLIVVVACQSETTSDPPGSTTDPDRASSTTGPTSVIAATTTSTEPTTTIAARPTTTLLEGIWAEKPLIATDSFFGALGWWDGDVWYQVQEGDVLPITGGEDYQVALLESDGLVLSGGPQIEACEVSVPVPGVEMNDGDAISAFLPGWEATGYYQGVAISAPWELTPYPVELMTDNGTYSGFATELLKFSGLTVSTPPIKQLIRTDLEGDGVDEVIVVAEDTEIAFDPVSGGYSIVFLRKVVNGQVRTFTVEDSVVGEGEEGYPAAFTVSAVADLNGDGQTELVISGLAYEAGWVGVYEYIGGSAGFVGVLGAGCGV